MSQMLNQLKQYDALYLIGGITSFQHYAVIENLMTTAGKMALAKSKPFKQSKHCLEPTVDYYSFYESLCFILDNQHTLGFLNHLNTPQCISPLVKSLMGNIIEVKQLDRLMPPNHLRLLEPQLSHAVDDYYTGIWNSLRGLANSNTFKIEQKKRKSLITKQCQENTRIVGKLLRQYDSLDVHCIAFRIFHNADIQMNDFTLRDSASAQILRQFINHIRQINSDDILCIQSRIQRTMTGQCYVNIFIYAKPDTQIDFNINLNQFHHNHEDDITQMHTYANELLHTQFRLFGSNSFAFNFEQWKVFFKCALYPLNHYYYESKHIKPTFTSILL
ncbi:hypothetical protein AYL20_01955 [Acinetobacter venetianus]|uniref:hypothetical protein n=1 Tax=Acinetobacter venetianus TaxID=52133 RepID=UPI00077587A3|nr:hypothetical protein [Acinetobacter venetianus]KXO82778.1 hypothetical protein AYL20_01955 [Acinetobacter venetianus]